jgi:hypothetical protein
MMRQVIPQSNQSLDEVRAAEAKESPASLRQD